MYRYVLQSRPSDTAVLKNNRKLSLLWLGWRVAKCKLDRSLLQKDQRINFNKITPAIYVIWTDPFFNTFKAELTWISCLDCNSFVCSALTDTNVLVNQAITREWPKGSQFDKTILVLIFEVAHLIKKEKNL